MCTTDVSVRLYVTKYVFNSLCALMYVGCCVHFFVLLGVSGTHPSSLLCSPRSLASLCCSALNLYLTFSLLYSPPVAGIDGKLVQLRGIQLVYIQCPSNTPNILGVLVFLNVFKAFSFIVGPRSQ